MDFIFVDLQGFKDSHNDFIIKELAIANKGHTQTFLIKPPYAYSFLTDEEKKCVSWIERKHKIYWSEGYIDYREFRRVIFPILKNKNILVKGTEKITWIKELCNQCNIINIGDRGCPSLLKLNNMYNTQINFNCMFHKEYCALKNVTLIKMWYNDNIKV